MMKQIIYWLYAKRVYLWITCLLTVMIFAIMVHVYKDWLNEPGHENFIILLLSLWVFSILTFYANAVAVTVHSPKIGARYGNFGKVFLIAFFTLITLFCCSVGISIMVAL